MTGIPLNTPQNVRKDFEIGDHVEVFCDHDWNEERIRDWLEGVVVKKSPKKVAVQFDRNVYLTDGWMVPDRVLWCQTNSADIRYPRQRSHRRPRQRLPRIQGEHSEEFENRGPFPENDL
ncbi:MAG: hypothetical protein DRI56_02470 [Chloroflexota bacterium]|nr:MAG: hypothetical protein DRI56_02470 [Chloroflexota bacterium]